jgi:hypothetical protein
MVETLKTSDRALKNNMPLIQISPISLNCSQSSLFERDSSDSWKLALCVLSASQIEERPRFRRDFFRYFFSKILSSMMAASFCSTERMGGRA